MTSPTQRTLAECRECGRQITDKKRRAFCSPRCSDADKNRKAWEWFEMICEELGIDDYMKEVPISDHREWRFDYSWVRLMSGSKFHQIAVEIDGGGFGAAHLRLAQAHKDQEKRNYATALGWKVFVFNPKAFDSPRARAETSEFLAQVFGVTQ